jgi:DNA-binding NtrC family response regulator
MADPLLPPRTSSFAALPRTMALSDLSGVLDGSVIERRCQLTVLSGAQSGRVVEITKPVFTVGKSETADLVLTDATVSREHFVVEQATGGFVVRDKESRNGTWIDQIRISAAYLRPAMILRAGEVLIRFEPLFSKVEVAPSTEERFGSLVGRSARMRQIFTLLERIARTEATVVLLGETGSGKSAVARAIHDESARANAPFVTIDCGAIAENLIESELFGHEKGAFTGATSSRQGALERAQKGTLFIDELVDLPLHLQPRLLRVLEEREVRRVGANESIKLDVRIIAASRKDLWREVEEGRFREDLYFRLAVFTLALPPLRERPEDIPLLASAFARSAPGGERLLGAGFDRLMGHPFYGNVRELRNVIERAIYLDGPPDTLLAAALAPDMSSTGRSGVASRLGGTEPSPLASSSSPFAVTPTGPPSSSLTLPTAASAVYKPPTAVAHASDVVLDSPSDVAVPLTADCTQPFKDAKEALLEQFEGEYIRRLITRESGSAVAMARSAGIDRKHLYTLAKKHGLSLKG